MRVELFKQAMGSLSRLAVIVYPADRVSAELLCVAEATAKERNIQILPINISKAEELEAAFQEAHQWGAQAVMPLQGPIFFFQQKKIAELAASYKLPLAGPEWGYADAGAVLEVSPDIPGCAARAVGFVDRILKGAKANELPVERCRMMHVVFNRNNDPTRSQTNT